MTLTLPDISAGAMTICDDAIELRIISDRPRDAIDALLELARTPHLALRVFDRASRGPGQPIDLDAELKPGPPGAHTAWDSRTQIRIDTGQATACIYIVPLGDADQSLHLADVAIRLQALTTPEAIRLAFGLDLDQCPALRRGQE